MPSAAERRRLGLIVFVALAAILALPAAGVRADDPPEQLTSNMARDFWLKGSDQALAGDFRGAYTTLERVRNIEPGDKRVATAIGWMREARDVSESRSRLRERSIEYYVGEANKLSAEEKWAKALDQAVLAQQNAVDKDEFAAQAWVKELAAKSLAEIAEYEKKGEWKDALVLYDDLRTLYPKDKEYQRRFDHCRRRVHFELVYGPKGTWKNDLRDIEPDVVREITDRVAKDYVKEVPFQEMATSALENLIVLAETPSLREVFTGLTDDEKRDHFVTRLKNLLDRRVRGQDSFGRRDLIRLFGSVEDVNEQSLRLPEAVLVDEFVSGMLEPLDEFTSVIWPAEVEEFNKHTRGEFVGVGIQITKEDAGFIRVESPLEDSPAYRAGVQPGDLITAVDGTSTMDMTITQAVNTITGEPGKKVVLTIKQPGSDATQDITLVREQIKIATVRGDHRDDSKPTKWEFMIDPDNKIGYVRVSGFVEQTVPDLAKALEQLKAEGCRGLVLDLRFNPGGLLTSAVAMCNLFLAEDDPMVKTVTRGRRQDMHVRAKGHNLFPPGFPMIVMVNEFSASASEIVAGALSGLNEACIIGSRTFGKGSVQNLIPIADNDAYLKLTTAHYYVPDSKSKDGWYCLNREKEAETWGVDPHIKVDLIPQELRKVLRLRRERDLLKGKNQKALPADVLDRRPTSQPAPTEQFDENPDVDPQLVVALNVMRVKLVSRQPWALAPRIPAGNVSEAHAKAPAAAGATADQRR